MQINMTAVLTADDISQAVAAFVAKETGNDASTINVTVPADYTVTAVMGNNDTGWVAPKAEEEVTKRTTRKATTKKEPEPEVTEENIPETSQESDTSEETPKEEPKKEGDLSALKSARKGGSIFNFEKK